MTYIQTTSPRTAVFYGESMADLALMPTTTKIGEGEYIHALAQEGSYAIILLTDGLKKFMLRSTGWVEIKDQGGGGSSWFEPGGNITFAELPTPSGDNVGIVYNITDAFTTDERFNEGAGIDYPAGTNVAIVNVGTDSTPVYKFDTYVGAYTTDDELSLVSENPVQNKVVTSEINKINTALQNKQDALTFDTLPNSFSNNPVASYGIYNALGYKSQLVWDSAPSSNDHAITSGAVYNAIGGVNGLTFLQAYDSTVAQLSAGFVFTPQGAYNMYANISRTIPSVAANVAGQVINSAIPQIMPKVYWFAVQGSDWDEYGEAVIDLQNDFQIVIPQTNYNQLIVQDGLNYWNDYAMELGNVNTDESGNITTLQFVCNIYNTQDPPSNPPTYMEFIIISTPATKNDETVSLSALYESPGLKALADKPNIDYTPSYTNTYSSMHIDQKVAGEEITTTATGSDLTLSTSSGNLNALTVYGKSEVVDGTIASAGEGWTTVDLGTLSWNYSDTRIAFNTPLSDISDGEIGKIKIKCGQYLTTDTVPSTSDVPTKPNMSIFQQKDNKQIFIRNTAYTDATAFKNSLNGVILAYQLADSTQGNTIAVKTDNGSGINGTMATFETGTPLRGIPDTTVRDVMTWDGSAGTVTKNCNKVRLVDLTWQWTGESPNSRFYATLPVVGWADNEETRIAWICNKYASAFYGDVFYHTSDKILALNRTGASVQIYDSSYDNLTDFVASLGDAELVYEIANPTTEQLTSTENASIAGLRTFEPQTHAQNNAGAEMTVEAYAGTENGKAVQELKQDVQSEISTLKITQSGTLTLTVADWSNNAQTVSYAHDTAKRNVIDVDPASVEEWASCGILATAETASGITFTCKTVPTNALNFRVTSMGV